MRKDKFYPPRFTLFNILRRPRRGVSLAEAVAIARPYGLEGDVEHCVLSYGITPRQALEDFDLIPPGAADGYLHALARSSRPSADDDTEKR